MRISDWSSDVCSSDLLRVDEIGGHVEFCSVGGAARPDVTELIGCFQLIIRMAWLWIGEDAKDRREDVAVAGQSCIGNILLKRPKIEIVTGFLYDIRSSERRVGKEGVIRCITRL